MKEFFGISPSAEFCCFKDAQANIVALLDNTGAVVVKYKYDAWGKCNAVILDESATDIANLNPFRYCSYHPANPKFKHWHYYFSLILGLFGIEPDNLD